MMENGRRVWREMSLLISELLNLRRASEAHLSSWTLGRDIVSVISARQRFTLQSVERDWICHTHDEHGSRRDRGTSRQVRHMLNEPGSAPDIHHSGASVVDQSICSNGIYSISHHPAQVLSGAKCIHAGRFQISTTPPRSPVTGSVGGMGTSDASAVNSPRRASSRQYSFFHFGAPCD